MNWYKTSQIEWFDSTGTWKVFFDDGWIIIQTDPDLDRYYMSRFNRSRAMLDRQLQRPSWGGHISVVRGFDRENFKIDEEKEKLLREIDGKSVNFSCENYVKSNDNLGGDGRHYYLDVKCEDALDLRERLGLPREPLYKLHLTIGVVKDSKGRTNELV